MYEWQTRVLPQPIQRDVQLSTDLPTKVRNATVITGFRRVGKTYLLFQTINRLLAKFDRSQVLYLNFEDERINRFETSLLTEILPQFQTVFGRQPQYIFVDELQLVPNWSRWVRRILDTYDVQFYVTGSSSKMSSSQLPTELRGRAWEVKVETLTFDEFLRFGQYDIDWDRVRVDQGERERVKALFFGYLQFGGLPAVVLATPAQKQELLQQYFQTVVQKDIAERHNVTNEMALKTMLKLLINSTYVTISKLSNSLKSLGIPAGKTTLSNYMDYTQNSYFLELLEIRSPAVVSRLQHPRKPYFVDSGFISALSINFSQNYGRLMENVVYRQLVKTYPSVFYHRDRLGREADFVIADGEQTLAIVQVCWDLSSQEIQTREVAGLTKAGRALGCDNLWLLTVDLPLWQIELPSQVRVVSWVDWIRGIRLN